MTLPPSISLDQVSAGLASVVSAARWPPCNWYHVGFSHEPAGHSNLSHLLEHLIFEGSSKLAAGQYSRVIARLGGNAQGRCFMAL